MAFSNQGNLAISKNLFKCKVKSIGIFANLRKVSIADSAFTVKLYQEMEASYLSTQIAIHTT